MTTFKGHIENNQIKLFAHVSQPQAQTTHKAFQALLDTGAQTTCISPGVIQELDLAVVGQTNLIPASGVISVVPVYRAYISISITTIFGSPIENKEPKHYLFYFGGRN